MVLNTLLVWHVPKRDGTFEASWVSLGGTQTIFHFNSYVFVLTFIRKQCELEPQAHGLPSVPASVEAGAGSPRASCILLSS